MSKGNSAAINPRDSVITEVDLPLLFKSLAVERTGSLICVQEQQISALGDDEVLIRVEFASINRMDPVLARSNAFDFPSPYVLGFDFSGEVVRLGAGAGYAFKLGAKVLGRTFFGGCFAEFVVAKKDHVLHRDNLPAPEASTYGIAYLTAYESLVITGNITRHAGKWIYVAGAAGGVGHFAAQIAKAYGMKVVGTGGKPASLDLLHSLALDHVIDYSKQDVVQEIMSLTGGKGVDVVYDSTFMQPSYAQSALVISAGGEYIRLGTAAQVARAGAEDMTLIVEGSGAKMVIGDLGRYRVDPHYEAQASRLMDGLRIAGTLYQQGRVRPVITETVPFDPVALQRAFEAFTKGENNVGKVVVRCRETT